MEVQKARADSLRPFRDLGTEGAEDADIALRECISGKHLIPGPRYYTANRAIVSSGSYGDSKFHCCHESC